MRKYYPTYAQGIGLLLLQIPIGVVLLLLIMPFGDIENIIISSLLNVLMLIGVIVIGLRLRKDNSFSYALFPVSALLLAILLILSLNVILDPLLVLLPVPDFLTKTFAEMANYPWLLFFSVVVSAPLLEEILFRGIILDGFLKNYTPFKSILISALLFGIIHFNFQQGIGAFLIGIIVGVLYWRTQSIALCISIHALNNFMAFLGIILLDEETQNMSVQEFVGDDTKFYALYACCVAITLGCGWVLWKQYLKPVQSHIHIAPAERSPADEPTV